jgi:hypothetical protein
MLVALGNVSPPLPDVSVKAERATLLTRGGNSVTLLRMSVQKHCGKCGASFLCQTNELCWCASYKIDEGQLTTMGQQYAGCLCEACLAALSSHDREQKNM